MGPRDRRGGLRRRQKLPTPPAAVADSFSADRRYYAMAEYVQNALGISAQIASVHFSYTISDDPSLHTRYIAADTGWKIILDRGLDIFQPFDRRDAFSLQKGEADTGPVRPAERRSGAG
ncbi:MAG: MIT C-terminal domain-containing protein [Spirochaetaceae bacterium]